MPSFGFKLLLKAFNLWVTLSWSHSFRLCYHNRCFVHLRE